MTILKRKNAILASIVVFLASGCAMGPDHICRPDERVSIGNADKPVKRSEDIKVSILDVDVPNRSVASSRLKTEIRNKLEGQVVDSGSILVDRKLAKKLKQDVQLAEQSGRYSTKGVPIADYVVDTEVTANNVTSSYREAYSYETKKHKTVYVPAKCSYSAEVSATMKVIAIPDMTLLKRIELSGSASSSNDTDDSDCPISQQRATRLITEAADSAIDENLEFKKQLVPSAPVLELRQCENYNMVKIGMGSKKHVKPKTNIAFSQNITNPEGESESFTIGEGKVVNVENDGIKSDYSWVEIDEELASKIRKGDKAKAEVSCETVGCYIKNFKLW